MASITAIFVTAFVLVSWSYVRAENARKNEAEQRHIADDARDDAERKEKAERWERYWANLAAASAELLLQKSDTARRALDAAPSSGTWRRASHVWPFRSPGMRGYR